MLTALIFPGKNLSAPIAKAIHAKATKVSLKTPIAWFLLNFFFSHLAVLLNPLTSDRKITAPASQYSSGGHILVAITTIATAIVI